MTHGGACSAIKPLGSRDKSLVMLWWGPVTNPHSFRGCRQQTHTHSVDLCEREIRHTHCLDLRTHTYTHWLSHTHGHRQWCCIAGWLGVKAKKSYWRQVGERRWLTKPNHTGECCLGHLTVRPLTVWHCVCLCIRLLTCSFACVCVCELWTRAVIIGAYRPERGRRRGARARLRASDRSWSWMGGWGDVMSHPDSYGQSHTQPENIFHTLNSVHPIKLSINYFNPQIKDSTKCLMFICWYSLEPAQTDWHVRFAFSISNCQHIGMIVDFTTQGNTGRPETSCKIQSQYN